MSKAVTSKLIWVALVCGAVLALGSCTLSPPLPPVERAAGPDADYYYPSALPSSPAPGPPSQLQAP